MTTKASWFPMIWLLLTISTGYALKAEQSTSSEKTRINSKDGAEMVFIPAGEFLMGSEEVDDEKPQRRVYLDGYWIYKYEVTVAQYRQFCQATRRKMPPEPTWGWKDNHPIVNVNWDEAAAYCQWAGGRLPTEAEWEKGARGTDGRKFPWGNQWEESKCHHSKKKFADAEGTAPVGSHPQGASPYGVHDMAGNVWEWCADWYDAHYYAKAEQRNPTGPRSTLKGMRVIRGGSWGNEVPDPFRVTNRLMDLPDHRNGSIGFRCVQSE